MTFVVLGLSYGGHDTSAAIMVDNNLIAAISQERCDLEKHSKNFPIDAINACLKEANLNINDVDEIAYPNDIRFYLNETYLKPAIKDFGRVGYLINDIERIKKFYDIENTIREKTSFKGKINFYLHHLCHVASAYFPSGFSEALISSIDGMGEIGTSMLASGREGIIEVLFDKNRYPNSLGLIYSAVTFFSWLEASL